MGQGVGTPTYRLFASLAWSAELGAPARQGSSASTVATPGETAAPLPTAAPEAKPPAPPSDSDGDGVVDTDDRCPTVVGDARPEAVRRGRVYAGFSGWGAGQLESELEEEAWIVEPPIPPELFPDDPATLWSEVLERKGGQYALVARMPDDPRLN